MPFTATPLLVSAIVGSVTTSPTPTSPSNPALRTDVQALIAAANLTVPSTSDANTLAQIGYTGSTSIHAVDHKNCGKYIKGGWDFDLNANPNCADIEKFEVMKQVYNDKCGLCVVFEWENCVGKISWSGKTSQLTDIVESRSWYCIA
ncbi:hypothetical protein BU25DRAFT_459246 [Macroventuria anomochaeta]|uniref:Uncharacterized protein n=1 Tax=Macroventuria anomochaeta TaxID=301207 RepID=A0ACB6S079_9PLEO|nr:uncharacterized protein BU25DRAFT_459246 [Macroventuria anomochaeta]KAF2626542.1 hypothetical protein BU25DRAFT_459246 [Macroventuria anomochaeta]